MRTSKEGLRPWMAAFGLVQVVFMVLDLQQYGPGNPRWAQSLSLAVACLAAIPLEEPWRKGVPWKQQLRTPNGLLWQAVCPVSSNPQAATLLQALQQYGAYMSDHGSAGFIQGVPDIRWNDNDLASKPHAARVFHKGSFVQHGNRS